MGTQTQQVNLNLSRGNGKSKIVKSVYVEGNQYEKLQKLAVREKRDVGNLIIFLLHEDCRSRNICVDPGDENASISLAYGQYVKEPEPNTESESKNKNKSFTGYTCRLIREYLRKNKNKLQENC